jgi:hypothetical protein
MGRVVTLGIGEHAFETWQESASVAFTFDLV